MSRLLLLVLLPVLALAAETAREDDLINRDWRFHFGAVAGAEAPAFDDAAWSRVHLPHSFSTPQFAATPDFPVGEGWYRRRLDLPSERVADRRVHLDFEGAFQVAEVFVNGTRVGGHRGGYTGFRLDITDAVRPGSNLLAVRVDNRWDPTLAPRAGEHQFSGGLYRDVHLVLTDPLHVAWYGTHVTTPDLTAASGRVRIATELRNDGPTPRQAVLRAEVVDPDGTLVTFVETPVTVAAHATATITQDTGAIATPRLWHPDHPHRYRVVSTLREGPRTTDRYESPFGFRWFSFSATTGFTLNGKPHYFRGTNVHQDHAGWGDAVTNRAFLRDVQRVKDAGMDFIRGSHYPHDPAFSEACDRVGVLFWSENCFWGTGGNRQEGTWSASAYPITAEHEATFERSVEDSLRDMIRIHRNHPSIIVWSMSNEPFFTDQHTLPKVRSFLKRLVALSHELDPTRPAAIGGCQRGDLDRCGDIAGYNGDGAKLFLNPGIANVVSEYGSTMEDRPGTFAPGWGDLPHGGPQDQPKPFTWRYPWRSGEALWCAFDHASIAGRRFGGMGFCDYFRLPKRQWYWYRQDYLGIPAPAWPTPGTPAGLRLTADTAVVEPCDGTADAHLVVTVVDAAGTPISTNVPITLRIVSGPGELPTGPGIAFAPDSDIPVRDGQAAISFHSWQAGTTVLRASSPGLPDAGLTLTCRGGPAWDGQPAPERPYVRFTGQREGEAERGRDNPTGSSGDAAGHSSRLANDGDRTTWWQADRPGSGTWWQVNLERFISVREIRLRLPPDLGDNIRIEIGDDGRGWKPWPGKRQELVSDAELTWRVTEPVRGLWLRVNFDRLQAPRTAALLEFTAVGSLAP